jgi:membrane protein involved in colicin uptake
MIVQMPPGCDGKPSDAAVAQGKKFLLECDKILQSKMKAIQLLETHVQPSSLDNIFAWLNGFIQAQPRPQIQTMHSLSSNFARPTSLSIAGAPALAASAWGQLLHDAIPYSPSDKLVRPCKCTPIEKDKQCKNEFCKFKLATDHSILLQSPLKQAILQRFDANRAKKERAEAEAVAKASQDAQAADNDRAAAAAKKLAKAAEKLTTQKEAAARRQAAMAKRATERNTVSAAAAAAAAAASKGKPAAAASKGKPAAAASAKSAASAKPAASAKSAASASAKPAAAVKSSITKKRKEGGSKSKSKRRLRK